MICTEACNSCHNSQTCIKCNHNYTLSTNFQCMQNCNQQKLNSYCYVQKELVNGLEINVQILKECNGLQSIPCFCGEAKNCALCYGNSKCSSCVAGYKMNEVGSCEICNKNLERIGVCPVQNKNIIAIWALLGGILVVFVLAACFVVFRVIKGKQEPMALPLLWDRNPEQLQ
ncbi:Cysteine-rich membrane protein 2 [Spironucleus salmonicida]|uniref:Cysteine-rich membrane protein 2 n=1 Tax=Spironucleus salmonicida TaxID=348837 RepID=V6LKV2_9EUKA|nr:Cysteine-rich membrane protein 2 [Spironucleus salmonicida]|eukprot:EST45260.1 hypothetical protein SS50377_14836 [Spironucleus salmonicida]